MKLKNYIKFIMITDHVFINGKNLSESDIDVYGKLLDNEISSIKVEYKEVFNRITNQREHGRVHYIVTREGKEE